MIKTALIGHPVAHSLSGVIHNAAFKSLGVDGKYEVIDVPSGKLPNVIDKLIKEGYSGFNVTIPYKVDVKNFLSMSDMFADYAGCTNCVKIKPNGVLYGYNTDIYGFSHAIPEDIRNNLKGTKVLILGNGGAARAVAVGLGMLEVSQIDFRVRDFDKAQPLCNSISSIFPNTSINLIKIIDNISQYSIIVNTTPLGTVGENQNKIPIASSLLANADKSALVYDLVYNPVETVLIKTAKSYGLKTVGGLDMLIGQAVKGFKIFTGKDADFDLMKNAALKYL